MCLCFFWQSGCGGRAGTMSRCSYSHRLCKLGALMCHTFGQSLLAGIGAFPSIFLNAVLPCTAEMPCVRALQRACQTCAEYRCKGMSPAKEHCEDCCRIHEVLLSHALLAMLVIPLALRWIAQDLQYALGYR